MRSGLRDSLSEGQSERADNRTSMRSEDHPSATLAERLAAATLLLGGEAARVKVLFDYAGMPSEYRSGLVAAREEAERFLDGQRRDDRAMDGDERARIELAKRIVELAHAVIFAMRHGLGYEAIMLAGARDLDHCMKDASGQG